MLHVENKEELNSILEKLSTDVKLKKIVTSFMGLILSLNDEYSLDIKDKSSGGNDLYREFLFLNKTTGFKIQMNFWDKRKNNETNYEFLSNNYSVASRTISDKEFTNKNVKNAYLKSFTESLTIGTLMKKTSPLKIEALLNYLKTKEVQ